MKQSGRFFQFLTSLVLVLAVLVPVRVVPAQAEEGEYTFEANVDFCDASTGHVWINGVDTREPAEPFIFDWGDGTVESAWFAANHVYSDTNLTYLVTITSALGGETAVTVEFANCPPLEIQAWIEEIIPETGYVRVNGFVRGSPLVRVEWGDGSEPTESFFPVEHEYADLGRDYVITVTGTYYDGSIGIQALPVTFAQAEDGGPRIFVEPNEDNVFAWNWPSGTLLFLEIDDPATPQSPDYSMSQVVNINNDWADAFELGGILDIQPGHVVTVSDGNISKQHVVTHLAITSIDLEADTISGTAYPGSTIHVGTICDDTGCANRNVIADENGNWVADFSIPAEGHGDAGIVFDIRPGSGSSAYEHVQGEDGDSTKVNWRVPNPSIVVRPLQDFVHGWGWPDGAWVTTTLDHPDTPQSPDYTETNQASYSAPWRPQDTLVEFVNGALDIKAGDVVTMTDGITTKTHVTTSLTVDQFDVDADTVSGTADPGSVVRNVNVCDNTGCSNRTTTTDQSGYWVTDFSIPGDENDPETIDIRPGTEGIAIQDDEDGDGTHIGWHVPNPAFSVRMRENEVHGYEWTFGSQVRLEIDDPNTPQSPDYTRTQTVTFADWDPNQTFVQFRVWENNFTLQPGMLVTMTDGSITKTHTVTGLVVLGADAATDTVWGTGTPGTWVEVGHLCDNDGCAIRRTVIAADGTWLLDFSVPGGPEPDEQKTFDIQECYGHEARQHDEDGDSTQYGWDTYCSAYIFIEQYTFNFNNPLLADLTIRRAIALGTDRQRILEQAFLPAEVYGQLVNSPLPPGNPYLAPASMLTLYPYNPDEARTLLANAGWVDTNGDGIREKNGQELAFTFKTTLNPMRTIAAQIFRENMEAIGIRITVVQETPGMFFADGGTLARGDFDIAEFAWGAGLEDIFLDLYKTGGEQNYGAYVNPVYDAALEAFKNAATEEARIAAAYLAQQIFTADLPAFYLFTRESIIPHQTPTGTNVTLTPLPQVTITYTNVNQEGITAALAVSLNPADLPQNMRLVDSAYEIGTTAMFETVKVCLAYRDHWMTPAQEAALRLYHYHNGVWNDVTDPGSPDTVNNIVCGTAADFSLFAILLPTDSTAPVITPVVTGTPGFNDWYTSAVTVEWQVSDPESGIAASAGCEPVTLATDTAGETLVCTATNGVGLAQSESVTIKIDRTPPVITWLGGIASGSSFYYGFVPPEPTCAASDLLSGLEEPCEVSGYQTTVGVHSLFARAADNAGNQAVESRTYTVLAWTLKGFYQPVDMNGVYNLIKGGSTVPFKFEIFAGPTELTNTAYIKSFTYAETACNANALTDEIELTATGGTSLRYDEISGQFIYNWKTPKTPGKCYRVTIIAHDGSALLAYFKIR